MKENTKRFTRLITGTTVPVVDFLTGDTVEDTDKPLRGLGSMYRGLVVASTGMVKVSELTHTVRAMEQKLNKKLVPCVRNSSELRRTRYGNYLDLELIFADNGQGMDSTYGDPCRRAKLGFRLQETSQFLSIVTVKIIDGPEDGHGYYVAGSLLAQHLERFSPFQMTGYELDGKGQMSHAAAIFKGMAIPAEKWDVPAKVREANVDFYINSNGFKLKGITVGSIVQVALYQQGSSLETKGRSKQMKVPWQAVFRMIEVMTEKGFNELLSMIRTMGMNLAGDLSSGHALLDRIFNIRDGIDGLENNEFASTVERLYRAGLPITPQDMAKMTVLYLKNNLKVTTLSRKVYAVTDSKLKGMKVMVNSKYRKKYPVGSFIPGMFRSPTIATEFVPPCEVVGYVQHGELRVSQEIMDLLVGDTDGDSITVVEFPFISKTRYQKRVSQLNKAFGGSVEDAIIGETRDFSVLDACIKQVASKTMVAFCDNDVSISYIMSNTGTPLLSTDTIDCISKVQAAVDHAKKSTILPEPSGEKSPSIYRLLGGKFEDLDSYHELVDEARIKCAEYTGRLGKLCLALLAVIPYVILPNIAVTSYERVEDPLDYRETKGPLTDEEREVAEFVRVQRLKNVFSVLAPHEQGWLKEHGLNRGGFMRVSEIQDVLAPEYLSKHVVGNYILSTWGTQLESMELRRPAAVLLAKRLVKAYKEITSKLSKATDNDERDAIFDEQKDLFLKLTEMKDVDVAAGALKYLATNILCANPKKLIGSTKFLVQLPQILGDYDLNDFLAGFHKNAGKRYQKDKNGSWEAKYYLSIFCPSLEE